MKNIGDEAILLGLKELIRREIPQAEIEVMGKGSHFPIGLRSFFRALFHPSLWMKPFRMVKSCDIFLLGGGGLFTEEESLLSPAFWALQGLFALWVDKPVYCLGISIGDVGFMNKIFCMSLFKRSKSIIVRDPFSKELLEKWGIKAVLGTDLALAIRLDFTKVITKEKYVVISLRPFKNIDENLYKIIAQFCDVIILKFGLQIRLIPFQDDYQSDTQTLNKFFELMKEKNKVFVHEFSSNIPDVLKILSGAEMVIGMRLHSGILSVILGVPFIPLSYMSKVTNFWSEFPEAMRLDTSELSLDGLLEAYTNNWNSKREGQNIQGALRKKLSDRVRSFSDLFAAL